MISYLRNKRSYKLVKLAVNTITVCSLIFAFLYYLNYDQNERYYLNLYVGCAKQVETSSPAMASSCDKYLKMYLQGRDLFFYSIEISIFLPIIFYGSTIFFENLIPQQSTVRKKG